MLMFWWLGKVAGEPDSYKDECALSDMSSPMEDHMVRITSYVLRHYVHEWSEDYTKNGSARSSDDHTFAFTSIMIPEIALKNPVA